MGLLDYMKIKMPSHRYTHTSTRIVHTRTHNIQAVQSAETQNIQNLQQILHTRTV